MHVSVRQYRSSDVPEVARRAEDGFTEIVKQVPGFSGWWLIDGGGGTAVTVTVAEDQAGVEESVNKARDWVQENAADLIEGSPTVVNGEVVAQVTADS
jgi:hypothetical protein